MTPIAKFIHEKTYFCKFPVASLAMVAQAADGWAGTQLGRRLTGKDHEIAV